MRDLLAAMRPRQWVKNSLVLIAPLAGGTLLDAPVAVQVGIAFVVFSLASSAMYLLNDVVDRDRDSAHPVKRDRPVAAGRLTARRAVTASVVLSALALAIASALSTPGFAALIAVYLGGTTLYSLRLKHEALYDVVLIAAGFLLRALAGGLATGTPLSAWFLVTTASGALFVAAGKRASELDALADTDGATRPSLVAYTPGYLRFLWTATGTVAITAIVVWSLEVAVGSPRPGLAQASVAPLTLAILRYAWWIDRGDAEAPEDVLRRDRGLVVLGVLWATLLFASTPALA